MADSRQPFDSQFVALAQQQPRRIVLPEAGDPRIVEAAQICMQRGIAEVVLLGDQAMLAGQGDEAGVKKIEMIDPASHIDAGRYVDLLLELRQHKGLTREQAEKWARTPLGFAMCMVKTGAADGCVAGVQHTTADVIRNALQIIGTARPGGRLSSSFVMQGADATYLFADCAINIDPDGETLAEIARQTADTAQNLVDIEPNIALLSFSTAGSAQHPSTEKVREAASLLHTESPELAVIGEIQFDAALLPSVRETKWPQAPNQNAANVFVFPNLDAGNIGYKIAERLGGYKAVGPVLQGLAKPVNDLSRGATVDAIVETIAVTAVQATC